VLSDPLYRQQRAALAAVASAIWRDPVGAVGKIEDLLQKGFAGERIAAAVTNDPAAYGALRGSDRLMDRMLAAGRERKQAVQAVPEAAARLRSLGSAYVNVLDAERQAIAEERRRMAVAIPALSTAAEDVLMRLTAEAKNNDRKLTASAGSSPPSAGHSTSALVAMPSFAAKRISSTVCHQRSAAPSRRCRTG
jgi:hypothetical protein